jgi:hypothetical protein
MNGTRTFNFVEQCIETIKTKTVSLASVLAVLAVVNPALAAVLVNDTWKDGTDTDPAAPAYAENNGATANDADADGDLESVWFQGGAGSLNPVGADGPLRGDLIGTTASASWTTYYTPEATPVTLAAEGDKLKITWVFTPTTVNTSNTSQNFRIAVVNSPESSRVTMNASPGDAQYAGYATFMNMGATLGNGNSFQLRERVQVDQASALLSASASWTPLANATGATNGAAGYTSGTQYTYTFEATRSATNGLDIVSRMQGEGLLGEADMAEVVFTDDTPNGNNFSFDTFQVRPSTAATTAEVFDTSLFKVEFISASIPTLDGDYNQDGSVNAADYVVWRKTNGTQPGYDTWRTNFGRAAAGSGLGRALGASAIPEPGAVVLVLVAFLKAAGIRRRRYHFMA